MKERTLCASIPFVFASLAILVLTVVLSQPASAQANSCNDGTDKTVGAPQTLRVDIPDGSDLQLFVSWTAPATGTPAFTYYVCRSPDNSTWTYLSYCSGKPSSTAPVYDLNTPGPLQACRDDNGILVALLSKKTPPPPLTQGLPYYYKVKACNKTGACGLFTSTMNPAVNINYNTPISCTNCGLPSMQGSILQAGGLITIATPAMSKVLTSVVLGSLDSTPFPFTSDPYQFYGSNNGTTGQRAPKGKLLVNLPGSGSLCSEGGLAWVARNLGFDAICVNYDNASTQENICTPSSNPGFTQTNVEQCFTAISQAKLDHTFANFGSIMIDCTQSTGQNIALCGNDAAHNKSPYKTGPYYYVASPYDSIIPRITTMLQWLCNNKDTSTTKWEKYLAGGVCTPIGQNAAPNWTIIILSGWSQGGGMSTFAADKNTVYRVINLSAPLLATNAVDNNDMTAATFFADFKNGSSATNIRNIYGLVSANDYNTNGPFHSIHYAPPPPYPANVLQTIWTAMGFDATDNNDGEVDLNCNVTNHMYMTFCSNDTNPLPILQLTTTGTPSHNFVNWAIPNDYSDNPPANGHADTLFQWNEDIWEYMLLETN